MSELNDKIIESRDDSGTYEQIDTTVTYEITGLFKDDSLKNKYKDTSELEVRPPKLTIRDNENIVEFDLTKNLVDDLYHSLKLVKKSYSNVDYYKTVRIKDILDVKNGWRKVPFMVYIFLFLVVIALVFR